MRLSSFAGFRDGLHALPHLLQAWQLENNSVAAEAAAINLARLRILCPVVALLNAAHAVVFFYAWQGADPTDGATRWKLALLATHVAMGLTMLLCTYAGHRLQHASHTRAGRVLPLAVIALAMAFAIAVVTFDQWVTPSITPFLITGLITSLVVYLRPASAAGLYLLAYAAFFYGMGLTQTNPAQLLSNRVNGIAACVMGLALSVLLWRKFTTITLQHKQLEQANLVLQQNQLELERLSRIDGLTKLYNRITFADMSRRELDRAQRAGGQTVILLLDLDHFKNTNDTWGHPAGDAVLRHVAQITAGSVRSTDLVGRLGGEEFMVLLPQTFPQDACALAEKLRARLESNPTPWEGSDIPATVSIGVASTSAAENHSFESLYQTADKALYQAKERGRNCVVYDPQGHDPVAP